MRRLLPALLLCGSPLAAQAPRPPALDAIRATDIRRDVDFLAGDYFRGREAGSPDELRASMWIATQLQAIGLKPAGEDGTFFQWFPMRRIRLADNSRIAIDGTALTLWKDATVSTTTDASLDLPILFVGAGLDSDLAGKDLTRVTFSPDFDGFPMFNSDGSKLVFASNRNGKQPRETNIFVADWVGK